VEGSARGDATPVLDQRASVLDTATSLHYVFRVDEKRYDALFKLIRTLSPSKFSLIEKAVVRQSAPMEVTVANCPPFTKEFAQAFGDALQTHHAMSNQAFTKDKTEYALIDAFLQIGVKAEDSGSRTRAGYDIKVNDVRWSIKTQADKGIKADEIHISKFMELGKGTWETADDLPALRDRFLHHMEDYERIFSLRHWLEQSEEAIDETLHYYELVEIPKSLLQEAKNGKFKWMAESRQTPKPGYCTVGDGAGDCKFELYFDGGTERKLQVRGLKMKYCVRVASWKFSV
jgi:hypothetical protein